MRHAEPITSAAGGNHGIYRHDDRRQRRQARLRRGGKGEPLLYLHGTDGLAEWPALLDRWPQSFDVIAPDHPGFGAIRSAGLHR